MSANNPTSEIVTYALPPEPDGPVWDEDGNKWERDGDYWKSETYGDHEWHDLLHSGTLTNTEPAPEPAWPTAPHVWHDGKVWERYDEWGYHTIGDYWHANHLNSSSSDVRERSRRFAREAVPVVMVPAAEWEVFRASVARRGCDGTEADLIHATDALTGGER